MRRAIGIGTGRTPGPGWALERGERGFDLIETGVGKAQAAAGSVWAFDAHRHAGVLNAGVAGALPGGGARLGDVLLALPSLFGDEGLETPGGFTPIESLGFPAGLFGEGGFEPTAEWRKTLASASDSAGPIATVSTCSARDHRAADLAKRTGAIAEAMEGAAIAAGLCRLSSTPTAFAELRVVSNTTGDRDAQRWDLEGALSRLGGLISGLDGSALAELVAPRA